MKKIMVLGMHVTPMLMEQDRRRWWCGLRFMMAWCLMLSCALYLGWVVNAHVLDYKWRMHAGAQSVQQRLEQAMLLANLVMSPSSRESSSDPARSVVALAVAQRKFLDRMDASLFYRDARQNSEWQRVHGRGSAPVLPAELIAELDANPFSDASAWPMVRWTSMGGPEPKLVALAPLRVGSDEPRWLGLQIPFRVIAGDAFHLSGCRLNLLDSKGAVALGDAAQQWGAARRVGALERDYLGYAGGVRSGQLILGRAMGPEGWRLLCTVDAKTVLLGLASDVLPVALLMMLIGFLLLRKKTGQAAVFDLGSDPGRGDDPFSAWPIALVVMRASDHALIAQNRHARELQRNRFDIAEVLGNIAGEEGRTEWITGDGRQIQLQCAPAEYRGEAVHVCVLSDISNHHQTSQALTAARRAADEAESAKSLHLATISHEIRTPLYGIMGNLELLGHTQLNHQQSHYLNTIRKSSSALQHLIDDILEVSRIEAGQMVVDSVPFSPLDLTTDTVRAFAGAAMQKNLQIFVCTDSRLPIRVLGDAAKVRQILGNLLSNAIKFTDTGMVFLRLRLTTKSGDRIGLHWQVSDTGIGIPLHDQGSIFEPFWQGASPYRQLGTGLGLPICHNLAALMNGHLELASIPEVGSRFSLHLPFMALPPGGRLDEEPVLSATPVIHLRSGVVDLAESATSWLRRWGATVRPYEPDAVPVSDDAVLVEIAPRETLPVFWRGPRVVAVPEGGEQALLQDRNLTVTVLSIKAIAHAVSIAQGVAHQDPPDSREGKSILDLVVLVVEDNPVNRLILTEQLQLMGCQVIAANSGEEALSVLEAGEFDAMITDIQLPDMTGFTLVARLRERGNLLPVIATTASGCIQDRARCLETGMVACLFKPMDMTDLRQALFSISQWPCHG